MGGKQRHLRVFGMIAVLLCRSSLGAQAVATVPSERRVTVQIDNLPVPTALETIAKAAQLQMFYGWRVLPAQMRVTLHLRDIPVTEAFAAALHGTGLGVVILPHGQAILGQVEDARTQMQGTIIGTVLDANTKRPIAGVVVSVDGTPAEGQTTEAGMFRLSNVPVGAHTLLVRRVGYMRQSRSVMVNDNAVLTVDVVLEPSTNILDQVVVTGMAVATELKAVPNAITVVTAKQLEERGIVRIDQLFRGDVPGVIALETGGGSGGGAGNVFGQVAMYARGASSLTGTQFSQGYALSADGIPAMKTYVDGVELRDPTFLNTIDVRSIERIEIIPGPQASTIYGSGAMMGVMQVFTKHGQQAPRSKATMTLSYGTIQNNFSSHLAPLHDESIHVDGQSGLFGYTMGGSYRYTGQWNPGQMERYISGFGSIRYDGRPVTVSGTFRTVSRTIRTAQFGLSRVAEAMQNGDYILNQFYFFPRPQDFTTPQQTLGLTFNVHTVPWWTQEAVVGQDASQTNQQARTPTFTAPSDTLLTLLLRMGTKTSETYRTTIAFPVSSDIQGTVTAGADHWKDIWNSSSTNTATLTGTLTGTPSLRRSAIWNSGEYVQGQLSVGETVHLTAGLRAEQSNSYGASAGTNYSPRYGVSIVHTFAGALTAKIRGAFGRATRPPALNQRIGFPSNQFAQFGVPIYWSPLPSQYIGPEYQSGTEGGMELYWNRTASLTVTRYIQDVKDAIVLVNGVDSVFFPTFNIYSAESQFVNLGRVRNDGWEATGTVNVGAWSGKGTWSWTRSRIVAVATPGVGSSAGQAQLTAQYVVGSQLQNVPEHTGALTLGRATRSMTVMSSLSFIGSAITINNSPVYNEFASARLAQHASRVSPQATPNWYSASRGYTRMDLTAGYNINPIIAATLHVQNVTNQYRSDYNINYPTQGRITQFGIRTRW